MMEAGQVGYMNVSKFCFQLLMQSVCYEYIINLYEGVTILLGWSHYSLRSSTRYNLDV